jgi:hypothetical protein
MTADGVPRPVQEGSVARPGVGPPVARVEGATPEEAETIVATLAQRLSPDEMHVWLAGVEKSHGVPDPDPEFVEKFGVVPNWTPINAIASGKTQLVIDEARRFVAD